MRIKSKRNVLLSRIILFKELYARRALQLFSAVVCSNYVKDYLMFLTRHFPSKYLDFKLKYAIAFLYSNEENIYTYF